VDPLVTPAAMDFSPLHVIAAVTVGVTVGLLAMGLRRWLVAILDGALQLWREVGPGVVHGVLRRRPGGPATPWFCGRCRSHNTVSAGRCYSCGARREDAQAFMPDGEAPAGPSAGRTQRTRRHG
jgi:hypothetical protein